MSSYGGRTEALIETSKISEPGEHFFEPEESLLDRVGSKNHADAR